MSVRSRCLVGWTAVGWAGLLSAGLACQAHLDHLPILYDDDDTPADDDDEDADGDGYSIDAGDCDDGDPTIHPTATDPCDGVDRDCDGEGLERCRDCGEILATGMGFPSGEYALDLDGDAQTSEVVTYCEMDAAGGGWTLIQATTDDWAASQALQTDYASFRGELVGDPGDAFRLPGKFWPELARDGELLMRVTPRGADGAACDQPLSYQVTSLTLEVPEGGPAVATGYQQPASILTDGTLSALDSGPNSWCVDERQIIPWFIGSCGDTNPTYHHDAWWAGNNPRAPYLQDTADVDGLVAADVCPGGVDELMGFQAATRMEFYLR